MANQAHNNDNKIASTILLTLFLLLLAPAPAFAQSTGFDTGRTFEVYAYGSGDFLATIFNGIAMITSGGFVHSLVKIGLLLALMYGVMISMSSFLGASGMGMMGGNKDIYRGEGFTTILSIALTAFVAVGLFLSPSATVSIIDRVDPSQTQVVGNVPFPSAFIPHMMSTIGDTIGKEFETVFSLPDSLQFRNGGIALGAKYTDALMNIYPPNSSTTGLPSSAHLVTKSLREYYIKCVFPNYASLDGNAGEKTSRLDELFTTEDLMTHLKSSLYRDPNMVILAPNDAGYASCAVAIDEIDSAWNSYLPEWRKDIEMKLSGNAGLSSISGAGNALNLGTGALTSAVMARYFADSSVDSNTILKTIAAANLLRDSVDTYLAYMGSPTSSAMTASRRATTSGWLTAAKFFNTIVHTTRAIVEGLIYGMSALLPLFFVLGGLSAVIFYGKIALWLQLWVPIYVIINLYADQEVVRVMNNIFLTENVKSPSLKTMDLVADQLELTLGYVGSLSPVVPAIAWGLISGGAYAMTSAIQAVGGGAAPATATSTGSQVAGMGNLNMGNMSMGNTTLAGSTALSSQAGYQAQLMGNMARTKALNELIPLTGGPEGYIGAAGNTAAINEFGNMAAQSGKLNGAGGSMRTLYDATAAGAKGEMGGAIAAATERAKVTGGSWESALAGNVEAGKMYEAAKNLGAQNYLKDMGFNKAAEAMTLGELQHGYAALETYNMGQLAGHDMNTREGRAEYYKGLTSAQGVDIGVRENNVSALNEQLKNMGIETRVKVGDTVKAKSADGMRITSLQATQGAERNVKDVQSTDTGTRVRTGDSSLHDDSHKTLAGTSSLDDRTHKTLTGTSHVHDDSDQHIFGHSVTVNNQTSVKSGYIEERANVINERMAGHEGYKERQLNPMTGAVVAGAYKNVITSQTQTVDGVTTSTLSVKDGAVLHASSDLGMVRNRNDDRLNYKTGVDTDGMPSHIVREGLKAGGMDKKKAEGTVVAGETGLAIFGEVTSVLMRLRTLKR
ncbi:MAG: conjugal transfer protein TraG N-terminal domain-containing protein [Syntrophales bacterium]|jgi:hypothetical protein|nr:conjugal transfer protein TraG N-terminal domain-containing protein [Syntrophales bacterium]